jgi:lysozyme
MNWIELEQELIADEGLELKAYRCTAGKLTIGVGHRLVGAEMELREISLERAGQLLRRDIENVIADLEYIFGPHCLDGWSQERQHALLNMGFQLGRTRLLSFTNMLAAVKRSDWKRAHMECLDSKYARKDAPRRALRVANKLYREV